MKTIFLATALAVMTATTAHAGWFDVEPPSTDEAMADQMEKLLKEGERQTGLPAITNFTEKRMVKWLYELRDQPNYRTYTYIVTMNGKLVKICDSVGYGVNASIQYSNPDKVVDYEDFVGDRVDSNVGTIPQAEPNGLFMPEGLAATYVMCVDGTNEDVKAIYVEPEIIVSPIELDYVNQ
jgi:hypothetical protein